MNTNIRKQSKSKKEDRAPTVARAVQGLSIIEKANWCCGSGIRWLASVRMPEGCGFKPWKKRGLLGSTGFPFSEERGAEDKGRAGRWRVSKVGHGSQF